MQLVWLCVWLKNCFLKNFAQSYKLLYLSQKKVLKSDDGDCKIFSSKYYCHITTHGSGGVIATMKQFTKQAC